MQATSHHQVPITTVTALESAVADITFALQEAARLSTPALPSADRTPISPAYTTLCHERHTARKRWQRARFLSAKREYHRYNNKVQRELCANRNASF